MMEKRKHALAEEHPDTLTSMGNLAGMTYLLNLEMWLSLECNSVMFVKHIEWMKKLRNWRVELLWRWRSPIAKCTEKQKSSISPIFFFRR